MFSTSLPTAKIIEMTRIAMILPEENPRKRQKKKLSRSVPLTTVFNSNVCARGADKPFHAEWVDLVRFNSEGKITQMKEFFDSGGTHNHLEEHESKTKDAK